MGHIALILFLSVVFPAFLIVSCDKQTIEEKKQIMKECEELGLLYENDTFYASCAKPKQDPIKECIQLYVDSIDEKYQHPDTVTNLREEDYSKVVQQCQKTFGD